MPTPGETTITCILVCGRLVHNMKMTSYRKGLWFEGNSLDFSREVAQQCASTDQLTTDPGREV